MGTVHQSVVDVVETLRAYAPEKSHGPGRPTKRRAEDAADGEKSSKIQKLGPGASRVSPIYSQDRESRLTSHSETNRTSNSQFRSPGRPARYR